MRNSTYIIGTICLLIIGTYSPVIPQEIEHVTLPDDLREVLDNYEQYWEAGDAQSLASLFTEDGYILRPDHPPVQGREAIASAYENAGGRLILRAYDYGIENNQAFILGGYAGHESWPDIGKFTLILKRMNGNWLIHSDMDNRNRED